MTSPQARSVPGSNRTFLLSQTEGLLAAFHHCGDLIPHRRHIDGRARPTRLARSRNCAGTVGFVNRWVESGRVSTTPPPTRSSPLWNGRSCPGMSSLTPTSPGRRGRLVLRVLQHQASSQLGCDDVTGRLRDNHPCARSGGGRTEPSTILGEAHVARCRWCPHPEDTSRGGDCGRSERAVPSTPRAPEGCRGWEPDGSRACVLAVPHP